VADTKISALTAATAVAGANEFAINEAGTSKKVTAAQLQDFLFANIGEYAPGTFTAPTGIYVQMVKRLILTGSQRATFQGDSRLRID
jgi:hypothetical protein